MTNDRITNDQEGGTALVCHSDLVIHWSLGLGYWSFSHAPAFALRFISCRARISMVRIRSLYVLYWLALAIGNAASPDLDSASASPDAVTTRTRRLVGETDSEIPLVYGELKHVKNPSVQRKQRTRTAEPRPRTDPFLRKII